MSHFVRIFFLLLMCFLILGLLLSWKIWEIILQCWTYCIRMSLTLMILFLRLLYLVILLEICNGLFSHFEQQILFMEKQAKTTEPTTDRHGHDGPSRGLILKHLNILKNGYWNRLSELRNGIAGRTVKGVTDHHRLFRELSLWTLWRRRRTDRRRHNGPSQAA